MSFTRLLVVLVIAVGGYHTWQKIQGRAPMSDSFKNAEVATYSPSGFSSVAMPNGAEKNVVLIFAPLNCPSDAAQRAESLAADLDRHGIPNRRSGSFALDVENPDATMQAAVQRTTAVLNGAIPAVFINGMAKANPTTAEVVEEYTRTRS